MIVLPVEYCAHTWLEMDKSQRKRRLSAELVQDAFQTLNLPQDTCNSGSDTSCKKNTTGWQNGPYSDISVTDTWNVSLPNINRSAPTNGFQFPLNYSANVGPLEELLRQNKAPNEVLDTDCCNVGVDFTSLSPGNVHRYQADVMTPQVKFSTANLSKVPPHFHKLPSPVSMTSPARLLVQPTKNLSYSSTNQYSLANEQCSMDISSHYLPAPKQQPKCYVSHDVFHDSVSPSSQLFHIQPTSPIIPYHSTAPSSDLSTTNSLPSQAPTLVNYSTRTSHFNNSAYDPNVRLINVNSCLPNLQKSYTSSSNCSNTAQLNVNSQHRSDTIRYSHRRQGHGDHKIISISDMKSEFSDCGSKFSPDNLNDLIVDTGCLVQTHTGVQSPVSSVDCVSTDKQQESLSGLGGTNLSATSSHSGQMHDRASIGSLFNDNKHTSPTSEHYPSGSSLSAATPHRNQIFSDTLYSDISKSPVSGQLSICSNLSVESTNRRESTLHSYNERFDCDLKKLPTNAPKVDMLKYNIHNVYLESNPNMVQNTKTGTASAGTYGPRVPIPSPLCSNSTTTQPAVPDTHYSKLDSTDISMGTPFCEIESDNEFSDTPDLSDKMNSAATPLNGQSQSSDTEIESSHLSPSERSSILSSPEILDIIGPVRRSPERSHNDMYNIYTSRVVSVQYMDDTVVNLNSQPQPGNEAVKNGLDSQKIYVRVSDVVDSIFDEVVNCS